MNILIKYPALFFFILLLFNSSCKTKNSKPALFELVTNSGIVFNNTVQDNDSINILNYRNFYNGGGVAIGDINNDGTAQSPPLTRISGCNAAMRLRGSGSLNRMT